MQIDVRHNFGELAAQLGRMADDVQEKVIARTLNRVVDQARTAMAREISAEFNITKGAVNDRLTVRKASFKAGSFYMTAVLASPGAKKRGINLIRFVTGKRIIGRKGAAQLKFKIKRTGGIKSIKGAFIGNQGRTVFMRDGTARLPIHSVSTIDVPQMFNTKRVNKRVTDYIAERLPIVMAQNMKQLMRGTR